VASGKQGGKLALTVASRKRTGRLDQEWGRVTLLFLLHLLPVLLNTWMCRPLLRKKNLLSLFFWLCGNMVLGSSEHSGWRPGRKGGQEKRAQHTLLCPVSFQTPIAFRSFPVTSTPCPGLRLQKEAGKSV
jgi:hypothetical protein